MPTVIIFGGSGALGSVVTQHFKDADWITITVDLRSSSISTHSIEIKGGNKEDALNIFQKLKENNVAQVDAVVSVAGGFLMGSVKDDNIFDNMNKMWSYNVQSAILASHIATHVLKEGGLLVLTGAAGALGPTPVTLAYGISKVSTHHLVASLASQNSGLPTGATVACIVPVMLDTPMNRKDMPNANFDDWTPLETVASTLVNWGNGKDRPSNGAMVQLKTQNKKTELVIL